MEMANSPPSKSLARGTFIAIEGLDRAGKTTQIQRLASRLKNHGKRVWLTRFPGTLTPPDLCRTNTLVNRKLDRTSLIGQMITSYLQGKSQIEDHVVHLLFSANRWEFAQEIESNIAAGITVISDRYIHSGMVYSAAKENPSLTLEWARTPDIGLPKPDVVVFLDLEPEVARERGGFGEERYEKEEMQKRVRDLYTRIRRDEKEGIVVVDAGRELMEVENGVWKCVEKIIEDVEAGKRGGKIGKVEK